VKLILELVPVSSVDEVKQATENTLMCHNFRTIPLKSLETFSQFPFFFFSVENIEQFDAARAFLKELDISENVWIGLMRPTNADQFSWT
jgi:hypothetical protein